MTNEVVIHITGEANGVKAAMKQATAEAKTGGDSAGRDFSAAFDKAISGNASGKFAKAFESLDKEAGASGEKAGTSWVAGWTRGFKLPKLDLSAFNKELEALTKTGEDTGKKVGAALKAGMKMELISSKTAGGAAAVIGAIGGAAGAALPMLTALGAVAGTVAIGIDGIKNSTESLLDPFGYLKMAVEDAFEKTLTPAMAEVAKTMPKLTAGFVEIANRLGDTVRMFTEWGASQAGVDALNGSLRASSEFIAGINDGLVEFVKTIVTVTGQAAPQMRALGEAFGSVLDNISSQLVYLSNEGILGTAIDNFSATLTGLGDVAGAVLGTLIEMGAAMGTGLGEMLTSLGDNFEPVNKGLVELAAAGGELFKALVPLMPVLAELAGEVFHQLAEAVKAATPGILAFSQWAAENSDTLKAWVPIIMSAVAAWRIFSALLKAWKAGAAIVSGVTAVADAVKKIGTNAKDAEKEVGLLQKTLDKLKVPAGALGSAAGSAGSGLMQGLGIAAGGAASKVVKPGLGLLGRGAMAAAPATGVLGGIVAGGAIGAYGVAKATGNDKASGNMEAAARGDFSFDELKAQAIAGIEATKQAIIAKFNEIKTAIVETVKGWSADIDAALKSVWDTLTGAGGGTSLGEKFTTMLTEAWQAVITTVSGWGAQIATYATGLWDQFTAALSEGWQQVVDFFTQSPFDLGKAIGDAIFPPIVQAGRDVWTFFTTGLSEGWATVTAWFTTIWTELTATLTAGWETVKTWFATTGTTAWNDFLLSLQAGWATVTAWFAQLPTMLTEAWTAVQNWFTVTLPQTATAAWTAFTLALQTAWTTTVAWLQTVPQMCIDALATLVTLLQTKATEAWTAFTTALQTAWTATLAWLSTVPQMVITAITTLTALLTTFATEAWTAFTTSLQAAWQTTLTWLQTVPQMIIDAIKTAATLIVQVGTDIMNGLLKGLQDGANAVTTWLTSFASGLIASAKAAVGAKSPSKKFRDKVGKPIMQGIAVGMRQEAGHTLRTMDRIMAKVNAAGVVAGFQAGDPRTIRGGGSRGGRGRHGWSGGWGRHQWSGGSRFPRSASVVAGFQMDDLRAQAAAQRGHGGGRHITFGGNTDSAFATSFMKLCRTGQIQIR